MRSLRISLLCFFLFTAMGFAEVVPQAPQVSYEGQNVGTVSLIANPHRDLGPLRACLTLRPGDSYSEEKIQTSAEALEKVGGFSKVQVSVAPDATGLRISFLLEPAYYLGVVEFSGVGKSLSYARLLQVVDLPDADPFDPSRLPAAEEALTTFLHKNGFFQAKVHPETRIDDAHQLVSISFAVEIGKQARIGALAMVGPVVAERAKLHHSVQSLRARLSGGLLKPGKVYDQERISAATSLLKKTLTKQHLLTAKVHENAPEYHPETNRVDVSFNIEVGPAVTVLAVGARLSRIPFLGGREMKKLVPIYSEGAIDQDLVDEGQRNLTDYFQKKGFTDVKVASSIQNQPDQITVLYQIDRGRKHKVGRILFHGNYAVSQKELMAHVVVRKSHIWTHGSFSQKLLKQSSDNIQAVYQDRGYEDVKVTAQAVDREPQIDITFEIEEGPQTIVEDVRVSGNENVPYAQLTAPNGFGLRSGTPYSPRKLAEDRNRISATYLNSGYPNAEVKATVQNAGNLHRVNVAYAITEHQMVRINEVVYLGQERTRLPLIARTAKILPETPMRRVQLLEAESRLYDLNIFDWSSVGPSKPITDQTDETALVKVHEANRNQIAYGVGFEVSHRGGNIPTGTVALPGGGGTIGLNGQQIAPSQSTFASPRGLIEYTRRNLHGLGETASGSILLSRLDQKVLTTYGQPHFIGSDWSSLTSFSVERNSENPLFTAGLGDLSFQVERLINKKTNTRLQLRYDFNKTDLSHLIVPELVLDQDRHVHLSTVSGTLIRDTRDKPLDAHRGMFATVDLGITPTALGSSANFAKLFGQYAFYKALRSIVLAAPFSNSFVPTSQLFFSGGGTSLRGFPIDAAGPQRLVPFCNVLQGQSGCVNITVPVGGKQLFILNSEVRFPLKIMKALGGVVFYDGGNVYSAINLSNFGNNYTNTVGFGLRYATPIGPVRIDIGRNLNPVPGINPTQYFITLGQSF